jgi:hypothetical protein
MSDAFLTAYLMGRSWGKSAAQAEVMDKIAKELPREPSEPNRKQRRAQEARRRKR